MRRPHSLRRVPKRIEQSYHIPATILSPAQKRLEDIKNGCYRRDGVYIELSGVSGLKRIPLEYEKGIQSCASLLLDGLNRHLAPDPQRTYLLTTIIEPKEPEQATRASWESTGDTEGCALMLIAFLAIFFIGKALFHVGDDIFQKRGTDLLPTIALGIGAFLALISWTG